MTYTVEKRNKKWFVVNDAGEAIGDGDLSEARAQAHLQTLAANAEPEMTKNIMPAVLAANAPAGVTWSNDITLNPVPEPLAKSDPEPTGKQFFIPLAKVDARLHQVWGYGALEQEDNSEEIMDYASSKPLWEKWSQATFARSGGKSYGNLRAMHQATAAGKLIKFETDDSRKGIWVGAEVIDPVEWKKVEAGVYTGFSVGGHYVRKWNDGKGRTRYTAEPIELSLVDAPCIPGATFQMVKADGIEEVTPFVEGKNENVLKADLPGTPDAAGTVTGLPEELTTVKAPQPDVPMIVSPDNPPAGDTLAGRVVGVQELAGAAEAASKGIGVTETVRKLRELADELEQLIKAEEAPALAKVEAEPAARPARIKVSKSIQPGLVKVRKAVH
jgi:hypothetical protein